MTVQKSSTARKRIGIQRPKRGGTYFELNGDQINFCVLMLARRFTNHQIHQMFRDRVTMKEYGMPILKSSYTTLWRWLKKISDEQSDEIAAKRKQWLESLEDVRLIAKKERCIELQKIFESAHDPKDRIAALREIRKEIGEDIEKLADALRGSGQPNVNVALYVGDLQPQERDKVDANLAAILGRRSAVNRFSEN